MQDFQAGDIAEAGSENEGEILPPYKTKQYEIGIKKDLGNFATTAALYQIETPTLAYTKNGYYAPHGKAKFRGLEVNTYAKLLNEKLRAGVGFNVQRGKYENQENPLENGKQTVATPKIIAKAAVEYDLLENLTLKAGAQHYGSVYQDRVNNYKIPSYTLIDAGLSYKSKVADKDLKINLGVDNLFNKNYWATHNSRQSTRGFAVLGMPRTVWLTGRLDL